MSLDNSVSSGSHGLQLSRRYFKYDSVHKRWGVAQGEDAPSQRIIRDLLGYAGEEFPVGP